MVAEPGTSTGVIEFPGGNKMTFHGGNMSSILHQLYLWEPLKLPHTFYISVIRCNGIDNDCCTAETPCDYLDGDCDTDDHCGEGFICGQDNCQGTGFDATDDCCNLGKGMQSFIKKCCLI